MPKRCLVNSFRKHYYYFFFSSTKAPFMNGAVHFVSCWCYVACIFRTMFLSTHFISIADYRICMCVRISSIVSHFATPWNVAHQVLMSKGFSRQEDWYHLSFPSPGDLPNRGIEPTYLASTALAGRFFTIASPGKYKVKVLIAQMCPIL